MMTSIRNKCTETVATNGLATSIIAPSTAGPFNDENVDISYREIHNKRTGSPVAH